MARAVTVSAASSKRSDRSAEQTRCGASARRRHRAVRRPSASRTTDAYSAHGCAAARFAHTNSGDAPARACARTEPDRARVLGCGAAGPATDDQPFQQAVGGQADWPRASRAGHLARGEEAGQFGAPMHVGDSHRHSCNGAPGTTGMGWRVGSIPADTHAAATVGKRPANREMPRASRYTHGSPGGAQPGVDGRGHHIARGEVSHRMNALGDRVALASR